MFKFIFSIVILFKCKALSLKSLLCFNISQFFYQVKQKFFNKILTNAYWNHHLVSLRATTHKEVTDASAQSATAYLEMVEIVEVSE